MKPKNFTQDICFLCCYFLMRKTFTDVPIVSILKLFDDGGFLETLYQNFLKNK